MSGIDAELDDIEARHTYTGSSTPKDWNRLMALARQTAPRMSDLPPFGWMQDGPGTFHYHQEPCPVCKLDREREQPPAASLPVPDITAARQAAVNAAAAYEAEAVGVMAGNPKYLLSVMLETARRAHEAAAPHIDAAARASERERLSVPELLIKIDGELTPEALDAIKARFIEAQKHGQIGELAPEPVFEPIADLIAAARASERENIRRELLSCTKCGKIHEKHRATSMHKGEPYEHDSWAAPDGHAYVQRWRAETFTRRDLADLIGGQT